MRQRLQFFSALLVCSWMALSPVIAAETPEFGLLATGPRAFPSLVADPREPQISLRAITPIRHETQAEVALGEYFSLYKWSFGSDEQFVQWLAGGGVFSRFNLIKPTKDLKVSDYSANMPVDVRFSRLCSLRVMPFHISSHLGDDFIAETGRLRQKYAVDSVKTLVAMEPTSHLRLYGGYQYIIRTVSEEHRQRHVLQGGVEWTSPWRGSRHVWQGYLAQDLQSWQRVGWNPQYVAQAGLRLKRSLDALPSAGLFLEFSAGHRSHGQFFLDKETRWGTGLRFNL